MEAQKTDGAKDSALACFISFLGFLVHLNPSHLAGSPSLSQTGLELISLGWAHTTASSYLNVALSLP